MRAILVTNHSNIKYLSGFDGTSGWLVVFEKGRKIIKGALLTDSRYHILARKILPSHIKLRDNAEGMMVALGKYLTSARVRTLGFEGDVIPYTQWQMLKKSLAPIKLVDIGTEIDTMRMIKRAEELRLISKAQTITDTVFESLKKSIKPGMSEQHIAWMVETIGRELGADDISFPPIIAINENSASPHHHPTAKKIRRGDLILIDMGFLYKGYCSDMTRVIFTKSPTSMEAKIYEIVLGAQEQAIHSIRAGIGGKAVDKIARDYIAKAGYGKKFGHSLGHGVGLDVHEMPNLASRYKGKIPRGSVVTVEPGIYLDGKFGVRLEDMVVVSTHGARNLTKSPKRLRESVIHI